MEWRRRSKPQSVQSLINAIRAGDVYSAMNHEVPGAPLGAKCYDAPKGALISYQTVFYKYLAPNGARKSGVKEHREEIKLLEYNSAAGG
jgi:hypothetical protein